jgi:hypothetical protein
MSFNLNGDKDADKDGAQTPGLGSVMPGYSGRASNGCLEARSPVRPGCRGQGLANGRLDAENEIGEVRLTWCPRMVAILVTDRPVGEGSLQAALSGI